MKWIVDVLDEALPELTGGRRDEIAELILKAIPSQRMVEWIAGATAAVLKQRGICDGSGDVSGELGRNAAAQTVLFMLYVHGLEEEVAELPAASSQR